MTHYLTKLKLTNIRRFHKIDLNFSRNGKPRLLTLIIGKNGTNKTTLLRSIALAFQKQNTITYLLEVGKCQMIRHGFSQGKIDIDLWEPSWTTGFTSELEFNVTLENRNGSEASCFGNVPPFGFVAAYGAGRFNQGPQSANTSVDSLFDDNIPLTDSHFALLQLRSKYQNGLYQKIIDRIKLITHLQPEDQIQTVDTGIVIKGPTTNQTELSLTNWADGYRRTFAWILDLYTLAMKNKAIDDDGFIQGILLIDEIEQHLHPSMQLGMLERLQKLLPRMQIIATSHSPMVALGLASDEIIVLKSEEGTTVQEPTPSLETYSAEDLLSDRHLFDSPVYAPAIAQKLDHYNNLASINQKTRTKEETQQLREAASELEALGVIGAPSDFKAELRELGRKLGV